MSPSENVRLAHNQDTARPCSGPTRSMLGLIPNRTAYVLAETPASMVLQDESRVGAIAKVSIASPFVLRA